jgi:hypothetical protein
VLDPLFKATTAKGQKSHFVFLCNEKLRCLAKGYTLIFGILFD